MSRFITEEGISLGYSSETDDYESECGRDSPLTAEPHEIYVGNTGKVRLDKCYQMFKQFGVIKDFTVWRTHNHLYHARIVYRAKEEAKNAVEKMNNRKAFGKRIRVSPVLERTVLKYAAAIRIDDIAPGVSEEDIYEHFEKCGEIDFVVKVGYAAYIQFKQATSASRALKLDMILNGDPYMLCRLAPDDRIDHVQVIDNMKDIKYRKPFVMVENYPELPYGELSRYKENFESIGPVRHFKIAATGNKTVTLALCMDRADDRDLVIDRFNDAVISGKRLKLYMAPGKARMMPQHVAKYAICKNSVKVDNIPAYFKDYEVCMLFAKCGATISFVEKVAHAWIICFDSPWMVSLVREHHIMTFQYELRITNLTQETMPIKSKIKLRDPDAHKTPNQALNKSEESKAKNEPNSVPLERRTEDLLKKAVQNIDRTSIKPPGNEPQKFNSPVAKVTPMAKQKASDDGSVCSNEDNNEKNLGFKKLYKEWYNSLMISNLPKGISADDVRTMFKEYEFRTITVYCSNDPYYPSSTAIMNLASKPAVKHIVKRHHERIQHKRIFIKTTIAHYWSGLNFASTKSIMLKNLHADVSEETILEEVEKILGPDTVEDVLKPTHYYAYFDLKGDLTARQVLHRLRNSFMRCKIDVFPLYCEVPKRYLGTNSLIRRSLVGTREKYGTRVCNDEDKELYGDQFGEHNAHRLFVGNIPRVAQTEDIIAYFNNFGTVIDYSRIEKKSCILRKSAIISFVDKKHARNAYCQQPHYLEGSLLGVHLMDGPPMSKSNRCQLLTVKVRTKYLTDDEIRDELQKVINIVYDLRFDAFNDRANYVAYYKDLKHKGVTSQNWLTIHHINDEPIKIIPGYEREGASDDDAFDQKITSPHRQQKESFLGYVVYTETLKKDMEMHTRLLGEQHVPYKSFYNEQSVQINNVARETRLVDFQDLFIKCGDIEYYRELYLEEDGSKICFIKFNIDLAADLACTYNQRMLHSKRILVHRAKETLASEWDCTVLLERLNPMTNAENIHDAFSTVGTVKYVQKQSPFTAIVCFKDAESVSGAMSVTSVPYSNHIMVNPCREEYNYSFYGNFSCQEQIFSVDQILVALKPRILPEFHQLEIERRNEDFDNENASTNEKRSQPTEADDEDEEELPAQPKRARLDAPNVQIQHSDAFDYGSGHSRDELVPQHRIEPIITTVNPNYEVDQRHANPGFDNMHRQHIGGMGRMPGPSQPPEWQMQQRIAARAYNAGPSFQQPRPLDGPRRQPMGFYRPPFYD
ncbi:uncharacterized protein LOC134203285 isoform X2 [Armigeres subalbatus]|uniref:uncharacterized protein LOC134203285 isoform X2 n=1 Tax=Armigeres subalbatus TaxID=124917 RepID=UPI002ED65001